MSSVMSSMNVDKIKREKFVSLRKNFLEKKNDSFGYFDFLLYITYLFAVMLILFLFPLNKLFL